MPLVVLSRYYAATRKISTRAKFAHCLYMNDENDVKMSIYIYIAGVWVYLNKF